MTFMIIVAHDPRNAFSWQYSHLYMRMSKLLQVLIYNMNLQDDSLCKNSCVTILVWLDI